MGNSNAPDQPCWSGALKLPINKCKLNRLKHVLSLLFCNYVIFYFPQKSPVPPSKNWHAPHYIPYLKSKFSGTLQNFLLKFFSPVILEDEVDNMILPNQLAPKQTANVQKMTAWLQNSTKTFIKRHHTEDLRKQEINRKISNWMKINASSQSLF